MKNWFHFRVLLPFQLFQLQTFPLVHKVPRYLPVYFTTGVTIVLFLY